MRDFKTSELYSSLVLETRILKSQCWQGHTPSEGSGGKAFLVISSCLLVVSIHGVPWHW